MGHHVSGPPVAVLHLEGAEAIDPELEALELWYAAGLRSIGPVWSRSNAFAHGVPLITPGTPDTGPGLTKAGFWGWTSDPYIGNYGDNSLLYFFNYQNAAPGSPLYQAARTGTDVSAAGGFFDILSADVKGGNLPEVSWIVAPEATGTMMRTNTMLRRAGTVDSNPGTSGVSSVIPRRGNIKIRWMA